MSPQQKADPPLNHAACYASKKQTALLSTAACAISVTVRTHNDLLHTACMHACMHPVYTPHGLLNLLTACCLAAGEETGITGRAYAHIVSVAGP